MTMSTVVAVELYQRVKREGPGAMTLLSADPAALLRTTLEALVAIGDLLVARQSYIDELTQSHLELQAAVETFLAAPPDVAEPEIAGQWETEMATAEAPEGPPEHP